MNNICLQLVKIEAKTKFIHEKVNYWSETNRISLHFVKIEANLAQS